MKKPPGRIADAGGRRVSWTVIGWGVLFVLIGGGAAALAVWAPGGDSGWRTPVVSAGAAVAAAGLFFFLLGAFVIRLGPKLRPFTSAEELVIRAAAGMIKVDGDAVHVEIEALRAWVERVFGREIGWDQLKSLAEQNNDEAHREAIATAVGDRHRKAEGWTAEHDMHVIRACATVLIADLRNRQVEKTYLRRLAEAVGLKAEQANALVASIDALELQLEDLVVGRILESQTAAARSAAA
jgi:uncharacterized tellurite resistance protein B-like protein